MRIGMKETVFGILDSKEIYKITKLHRSTVMYSIVGHDNFQTFIRTAKFFNLDYHEVVLRVYHYIHQWEKANKIKFLATPPMVTYPVYGKCTRRTLIEILQRRQTIKKEDA